MTDALAGMAAAHPSLSVDIENRVVTRADAPVAGKVGLVSGGGSGHEPLHAGFVGHGMLDAACAGEVFTSPVPDQIVIATTACLCSSLDGRLPPFYVSGGKHRSTMRNAIPGAPARRELPSACQQHRNLLLLAG